MMGTKARIFTPVTAVSLDELVPATHFYRHLDGVVDLSFVRDLVKETYARAGRPPLIQWSSGTAAARDVLRRHSSGSTLDATCC
jgi:hypothetical protein